MTGPDTTAGSATILVVEDNADVRRLAVRQLVEFGYHVLEAENGDAAMTILRQDQPIELLFTDIVMPGGTRGDQLAQEARRLRPPLKVLFTSGFAETAMPFGTGGREIPKRSLLSKPYRKAELRERIREALESEPEPL